MGPLRLYTVAWVPRRLPVIVRDPRDYCREQVIVIASIPQIMTTVRITVIIPVFLLLTSSLAGCTSNDSGHRGIWDNCKLYQPTEKQLEDDYYGIIFGDTGPNWGADLTNCDFRNADLTQEYLTGADLSGSDLSGADFTDQYLNDVDLSNTKLVGAIFTDARAEGYTTFSGADLSDADLSDMYFYNTDLSFTRLVNANLRDTYFESHSGRAATLYGADLTGADLTGAEQLRDVDLNGIILDNTICPGGDNSDTMRGQCPEVGISSENSSYDETGVLILFALFLTLMIGRGKKKKSKPTF